ncbi:hypothetical protein ACIBL3_09935 [Kribbella sp. NPDC050124]|uniref:hypothetical protein n=1 Tax=Kribbella sp. NPDC050124 TaxID=3364114 RepID=UPI0037887093
MGDGSQAGAARANQDRQPSDYAGAIYGSLLAASVVAGTGPGQEPPHPGELMVLLLATGVVFWLAHVYAHLVGEHSTRALMSWREFRVAGRREWPIVQAAVPPAAAAGIAGLLGVPDAGAAWLALAVAVGSQLGWALYVAARAGATWTRLVAAGVVNLVLGLVIVLLKAALTH